MDYIFTARTQTGDTFGNEPGKAKYLEIADPVGQPERGWILPKTQWFARVIDKATIATKPGAKPGSTIAVGDVLVYVHGFNTPQSVMIARHRLIRKGLESFGYRGAVVSFDWPCADFALNYAEDRIDANKTAMQLVTDGIAPFSQIVRQDCEISVHILAHSMGAYVLREAFKDAEDRKQVAAANWSVSQVMICSGDVSADSMGITRDSAALYRHCVRLTNYFNPYDSILTLSNAKRVGLSPRVGRHGLPLITPPNAVNVDTGAYFHASRDSFAHVANASHSWYFHDPVFLEDVFHTLQGTVDRKVIPTRELRDTNLILRVPPGA